MNAPHVYVILIFPVLFVFAFWYLAFLYTKKNVGSDKGFGFVDIGQSGLQRNIAADERETSIAPSFNPSLGILLLKSSWL